MEGGGLIGKGAMGCVFKPALPCIRKRKNESNDLVSKLVVKKEYDLELKIRKIMKKIDPKSEFSLYVKSSCTLDKKKLVSEDEYNKCVGPFTFGKNYILKLDYGGENLFNILKQFSDLNSIDLKKNQLIAHAICIEFSRILYGLSTINKAGYVHADLKTENLTFNHSNNQMRIIDFGKFKRTEIIDNLSSVNIPPESLLILKYYTLTININKLLNLDYSKENNKNYLKELCKKTIHFLKKGFLFGLIPGHEQGGIRNTILEKELVIDYFEKHQVYNYHKMYDSLLQIINIISEEKPDKRELAFYYLIYNNNDCWRIAFAILQAFFILKPFIYKPFYYDIVNKLLPKMFDHIFYRIHISDAHKEYMEYIKIHFKDSSDSNVKVQLHSNKYYILDS